MSIPFTEESHSGAWKDFMLLPSKERQGMRLTMSYIKVLIRQKSFDAADMKEETQNYLEKMSKLREELLNFEVILDYYA